MSWWGVFNSKYLYKKRNMKKNTVVTLILSKLSCNLFLFILLNIVFIHTANAQLNFAVNDSNQVEPVYLECDSIIRDGIVYKFKYTTLEVKFDAAKKPIEILLHGCYFNAVSYNEDIATDVTLYGSFTVKIRNPYNPSEQNTCMLSSPLPIKYTDAFGAENAGLLGEIICPVRNYSSNLFKNKTKLKSISTNNIIKLAEDISGMFEGCSNLITADLSNFDTEDVTDMSYMFMGCSSLTTLDLTNFDTGNVLDMRFMFDGCSCLTYLNVSQFDTGNVLNMSLMFRDCSALTSLDVSRFNTKNVSDMGQMFAGCQSLTSLNVSNFDTGNVEAMEKMFYDCRALTNLDVSHFNTKNVYVMFDMFRGCHSLTVLNVSNFDTMESFDISGMFANCFSLTSLDVSNFNTKNVCMMYEMFSCCSSLKKLDISSFDTRNVEHMEYMFENCSGLTNIDVSIFDTSKVIDMSYMFRNCSGLTNINVSNFNTSRVMDMSSMFESCSGLTSIDLRNFDTSKVTDMSNMFESCSGLTSIDLSNFDTSSVTDMRYLFRWCSNLTTIYCDEIWTCEKSNDMFSGCISLKGAIEYDDKKVDASYANPITGYFTSKPTIIYTMPASGIGTFSAATNMIIPTGLAAYYCTTLTTINNELCINVKPMGGNVIPANTGVLLLGEGGAQYTITASAITVTPDDMANNALVAVVEPTHIDQINGEYTNFVMSGGKFVKIQQTSDGKIPANRAYLQLLTANLANAARISIVRNDDTASVMEVPESARTDANNATCYTIDGRYIEKKPTTKGLYILNGRKTMVK